MQIVNYLYTLQGEAAGAQALSNFDSLLAPFIKHDNLNYEQVKQEIQKFLFNMNVPTRVGFQSPFTNITMDLTTPSYMVDEPAIIGGDLIDNNFNDYAEEMDLINHAFAEIMHDGDAKGRPFTFPIPTYNITKDFSWNNDGLDPIWEMTAKYGIPYFSNFINSDMKPDDARSMCCRLRLDNRELKKRGGGLFGANPKTGSVGVVTINMPRIGYLAKDDTQFFDILEKNMILAKQSLEIKRELIENLTYSGLHPYSRFYLNDVKETFGEYWKNHFSTIGLIGMNDALLNFMNKSIADKEGKAFAEKVLDFMREKIADYQQETGNIFNLEATPAEGASYRLARIDQNKYSDLRTYNKEKYANNGVEPYYTNSTQLPVGYTSDIFEALDLQDSLQTKYTGGTVLHLFLGESDPSPTATKNLIRRVAENYALPYYTITPTFSVCPDHGYIPGEHTTCPTCYAENKTNECEVYSRVVGYLRPVRQWNRGKQQEFKDRKTFKLPVKKLLVTT
jgi:anaerobic ribonucleoside-triphosphate reductase